MKRFKNLLILAIVIAVLSTVLAACSATTEPTAVPTTAPTAEPTEVPTEVPTAIPTEVPTEAPTEAPTEIPTEAPTEAPTEIPTEIPTEAPTPKPAKIIQNGDIRLDMYDTYCLLWGGLPYINEEWTVDWVIVSEETDIKRFQLYKDGIILDVSGEYILEYYDFRNEPYSLHIDADFSGELLEGTTYLPNRCDNPYNSAGIEKVMSDCFNKTWGYVRLPEYGIPKIFEHHYKYAGEKPDYLVVEWQENADELKYYFKLGNTRWEIDPEKPINDLWNFSMDRCFSIDFGNFTVHIAENSINEDEYVYVDTNTQLFRIGETEGEGKTPRDLLSELMG